MINIIKLATGQVLINDLSTEDKDIFIQQNSIVEKTSTGVQVKSIHRTAVYNIDLDKINALILSDGKEIIPIDISALFTVLTSNFFISLSALNATDLEISSNPEGSDIFAVHKFGENVEIDNTETNADIWDGGSEYIPPTTDRAHTIVSTSLQDIGSLTSTGTITSTSDVKIIDSSATFIADGVNVGDVVLNDTIQLNSIVTAVDSETELSIRVIEDSSQAGNTYRIVEKTGTGAATIHIDQGRQEDGTKVEEYIILNGTTPVATVNTYYRVSSMHIHGAGSNESNVGTMDLTADTDITITAQIRPDNGRTLMAFYHIPTGFTGFVTNYCVSMFKSPGAVNALSRIQLKTRLWGNGNDGVKSQHSKGVSINGGEAKHEFKPPLRLEQGTDVWLRAVETTDNNTFIQGCFDLIVINNDCL